MVFVGKQPDEENPEIHANIVENLGDTPFVDGSVVLRDENKMAVPMNDSGKVVETVQTEDDSIIGQRVLSGSP